MSESIYTAAGQTTVPDDIVAALNLKDGTRLAWTVLADGTVVVRSKWRKLTDLGGAMEVPAYTRVNLKQMNPEL
jgi:bifunctional DNA-binding transcriptional regulator/antitoxin component of YhaV-PrlF toxin-antitoxin module